jgi:hypothetical protein
MKVVTRLLLSLFSSGITGTVHAQTPAPLPPALPGSASLPTLVHLDTPEMLRRGVYTGQFGLRAFGGDEGVAYLSFAAQTGFAEGWDGILRATTAQERSFALSGADIRHGGSDIELVAKYRFPRTLDGPTRLQGALLLGLAFPGTPAQSGVVPTLGLALSSPVSPRVNLYLNPRAVLLKDNLLYGIGFGASGRLSDSLTLVGDVTPLIRGDNTRSVTDGARKKGTVYGLALRMTPRPRPDGSGLSFDIGYANGTGVTTGFAMTPGLGGSGSFYAALSYRR